MGRAVFLMALLALTGAIRGNAQAAPACDPTTELVGWLNRNAQDDRVVLAYDHKTAGWRAYEWDFARDGANQPAGQLTEQPRRVAAGVDLVPRFALRREEQILVVAADTHPSVFAGTATATTEAPHEELAALQDLAALLGNVITAAVGIAGDSHNETSRLAAMVRASSIPTARVPDAIQRSMALRVTRPVESENLRLETLRTIRADILATIRASLGAFAAPARQARTDALQLKAQLDVTQTAQRDVKTYLEALQRDVAVAPLANHRPALETLRGAAKTAEDALRVSLAALPEVGCAAPMAAATTALTTEIRGIPKDEKGEQLDAFLLAVEALGAERAARAGCSAEESRNLQLLADWLFQFRPGLTPPKDDELKELSVLRAGIALQLGLVPERAQIAEKGEQLLAGTAQLSAVYDALEAALKREAEHADPTDLASATPTLCSLRHGVLEIFDGRPALKHFQVQNRGFTLVRDTTLPSPKVTNARVDAAPKYQLAWRGAADLGVNVGVIYTEMRQRRWKAVEVPIAPAGAKADPAPVKGILRTGEETLAGDLAAILSWSPRQQDRVARFGLDVGAILDDDNPGLLGGFSFTFADFVRIGAGWSYRIVEQLGPGQLELRRLADGSFDPASITPVADDAAIRTRDKGDDNWYVSLSIGLDELPFFKKSE